MANIMLTDICNLRCPYCFANEFVNKAPNEISLSNFNKALNFIASDPRNRSVGLIGGEPTIHSKFKDILKMLISDSRFDQVVIYTNAVAIDEHMNELAHGKFRLLVNCNSPDDMGQVAFKKMIANLDEMICNRYMGDRLSLGINIYRPDFDYTYVLNLLKKYKLKALRFAIAVPNLDAERNMNALKYFRMFKQPIKKFFKVMLDNGITPYYDCNKMPSCMFDEGDIDEFIRYLPGTNRNEMLFADPNDHSINNNQVHCSPVIDIRYDLTVVRCFGLSEYTKVKITDFTTFAELYNYYMNTIDAFAYNTTCSQECYDCYKRKTAQCTGGCLAYKISDILRLQQIAKNAMKREKSDG